MPALPMHLWLMVNPIFSGAVSSISFFIVAAVLAHAYPYLCKTCQIGVPAFASLGGGVRNQIQSYTLS